MTDFKFSCPACFSSLVALSSDLYCCPNDGYQYKKENGIWRFLLPDRYTVYRQFIQEYETIREAEGRGSNDPGYYRSLPFRDSTDRHSWAWKIRGISYSSFMRRVLHSLEEKLRRPLKVLDLGAGNGWLSNRMALRGHQVAAVDLLVNELDGLGAYKYYQASFIPVQAEFDRLPLVGNQADLVIFNASFHYSTNFETTVCEALRVLQPGRPVVILDTPIYHDPYSGEQMVIEREAEFVRRYGFASNALPSENFLTYHRLKELAKKLNIQWDYFFPFYGLSWIARPFWAYLRGYREPAGFVVLVGSMRGFGFVV